MEKKYVCTMCGSRFEEPIKNCPACGGKVVDSEVTRLNDPDDFGDRTRTVGSGAAPSRPDWSGAAPSRPDWSGAAPSRPAAKGSQSNTPLAGGREGAAPLPPSPQKGPSVGLIIGIAAFVVVCAISGMWLYKSHADRVAREQFVADSIEQARIDSINYATRIDSLYHNFTTPDLRFAQVRGCVKQIKMTVKYSEFNYVSLTFTLKFDTYGVLQSVKLNKAFYNSPRTCKKFSRNSAGMVTRLFFDFTEYEYETDSEEYTFTYGH